MVHFSSPCFLPSFSWWFILFFIINKLILVQSQSCGPRVSPRMLKDNIPCDLSLVNYCTQPGSAYPWGAVRRYIFENQGLIKKMYGEQRQSQIVQEELRRLNEQYFQQQDLFDGSSVVWRNARKHNLQQPSPSSSSLLITNDVPHVKDNATMASTVINGGSLVSVDEDKYEPTTTNTNNNKPLITILSTESSSLDYEESFTTTSSSNTDNDIPDDIDNNNVVDDDENSKEQVIKGYNACPITQEVVAPYWANNTRGETLALLNVYPFEQYIHWEKCSYENEQMFCRDGCRCEQQYRLHRLLAFDPKNECRGIFADWFRFPACCVCICYDQILPQPQQSQSQQPQENHERINNRKARL